MVHLIALLGRSRVYLCSLSPLFSSLDAHVTPAGGFALRGKTPFTLTTQALVPVISRMPLAEMERPIRELLPSWEW